MTSTTLSESIDKFTAPSSRLRRKCVDEFAGWLKAAAGHGRHLTSSEINHRASAARGQFADEFINAVAPAIVRTLDPELEQIVVQQLKTFQLHLQLAVTSESEQGRERGRARGTPAVMIGATLGAAIALLLLATQVQPPPGNAAQVEMNMKPPQPSEPNAVAPSRNGSATAEGQKPAAERDNSAAVEAAGPAAGTRLHQFVMSVLWIVVGAAGAALGTLIAGAFRFGVRFATDAGTRGAKATEVLDQHLAADARLLSQLSAALTLQKPESGLLAEVRSIVLDRRERREPGEEILQLIEQEIGLPVGPRSEAPTSPSAKTEFIWGPQYAQQYNSFGVVEEGDLVEVKMPPRTNVGASGVTTVLKKGLVARKRAR
jgi:hypothetical protein